MKRLKILVLEDIPSDERLINRELKKLDSEYLIKRVETERTFIDGIKEFNPDIVLADYNLPSYDGITALNYCVQNHPTIPLIIVTGSLDEERAVETIKAGAWDYVLKDNLIRLVPAIRNALKLKEEKERKIQAEIELRESELKYRLIAEHTSDTIAITTFDQKSQYLYVSPSTKTVHGYDPEELIGRSFFDFIHPDDKIKLLPILKKYLSMKIKKLLSGRESDIKETIEFRFKHKDGRWQYMQSTINIAGNKLIGVSRDITENKRADLALKESEFNLRSLFNTMTDVVFEMDYEGKYLNIAPTSPELMFKPKNELMGKSLHEVFPEHQADKFLKVVRESLDENKAVLIEYPLQIENKTIWFVGKATPKTKNTILFIAHDITERKKMEIALRDSEQLTRTVIEGSPIGISVRDKNGTLLLANKAWRTVWSLSEQEVTDYLKKRKALSFDDRDSYLGKYQNEIRNVYENGGQYFIPEMKLSHPQKNKAEWISQFFYALTDENNEIMRVVILTEDITARKKAEKQITKDLNEKSILLQEIHHRVKNNLQIISSMLNMQTHYIKNDSDLDLFLDSKNRVISMALIHELLYKSADMTNIDFDVYIKNLSRKLFLSYQVNAGIIRLNLDVKNISLNINQSIPCGLLINELISNSMKHAFPENRRGIISVSFRNENEKKILIVADDGIGIPDEINLENPDSMGLQLIVALVDQLHGKITLKRENGTEFIIKFGTFSSKTYHKV